MWLIELLFITENRKQIPLSLSLSLLVVLLARGEVNLDGAKKPPLTKLKANTFQLHIRSALQQRGVGRGGGGVVGK